MRSERFYGPGARRVQESMDTVGLADHIAERYVSESVEGAPAEVVAGADCFYLATADAHGRPDCSYKGGLPGFVRLRGPREIVFPSYDGNGMFRSLGNVLENPAVGLLFIDYGRPLKVRVNGDARVLAAGESPEHFEGADAVVHVAVREVFENCPRYLHDVRAAGHSPHAPRAGHTPPEPQWKKKSEYEGLLRRAAG
ncbi:pyridoxamine 5'-phosphate oxidase family protein [Streptomyces sp. TRM 70351]|uniref:pyridoxamine 5'-phosphate oxidase family protein n=1 Tax=Streptomyces sp. TRM 70351 TaxID=3116552 RepID=UPI002E7C314C|nr:pyridoxamine 5'-phosphate oxidase family protein [Streptomyces sp. TRM 70351]MEE1930438.1 pyridoxamine 5'-phosphate oxidase family protein [Streptomyces sp. TRM 70351]